MCLVISTTAVIFVNCNHLCMNLTRAPARCRCIWNRRLPAGTFLLMHILFNKVRPCHIYWGITQMCDATCCTCYNYKGVDGQKQQDIFLMVRSTCSGCPMSLNCWFHYHHIGTFFVLVSNQHIPLYSTSDSTVTTVVLTRNQTYELLKRTQKQ